jgi:uncharacterized Zn finger protein (UPF0148 family)
VLAHTAGRTFTARPSHGLDDAHNVRLQLKVKQLSQQLQDVERRNQATQKQLERETARKLKLQQQKDDEQHRHEAWLAQLEREHAEETRRAAEERDMLTAVE